LPVILLSCTEEQDGGSVSPFGGIVPAEDRQKENINCKIMSKKKKSKAIPVTGHEGP
jgi:hypothetical protein